MSLAKTLIKKEIERCERAIKDRKDSIKEIPKNKDLTKDVIARFIKAWETDAADAEKCIKQLSADLKKLCS